MPVLTLDELPRRVVSQLASLAVTDGDPPVDLGTIRRLRREGYPASPYWGVYVLEGERLRSRVETIELPFRGPHGSETVAGIADVLTQPDAAGRGHARKLLREVHRRERALGRRLAFLWTRRTWGAHRLYEHEGYANVYSPPSAVAWIPSGRRPRSASYAWRSARRADASRLERLLTSATADRWGFYPRPDGSFRLRFRMEWRRPENHRFLSVDGRDVGYVHLGSSTSWAVVVNEVMLTDPRWIRTAVLAVEALAAGRWLALQGTSFVRDAEAILRRRGYQLLPVSHAVLMARSLRDADPGLRRVTEAIDRPEFACQRGDMF